jgi:hypothetical protein
VAGLIGDTVDGLFDGHSVHSESDDSDESEKKKSKKERVLTVDEEGNLVEIDEEGNVTVVGPPEETFTNTEVPKEIPGLIEHDKNSVDAMGQGRLPSGLIGKIMKAFGDLLGADIGPSS